MREPDEARETAGKNDGIKGIHAFLLSFCAALRVRTRTIGFIHRILLFLYPYLLSRKAFADHARLLNDSAGVVPAILQSFPSVARCNGEKYWSFVCAPAAMWRRAHVSLE